MKKGLDTSSPFFYLGENRVIEHPHYASGTRLKLDSRQISLNSYRNITKLVHS